jgi:4-amino-4-deoxy-L-arabinose transferase-like glycosyltransferase
MTEEPKNADNRMSKIKSWLKNPYNAALVCIIALALIVRLYFFVKTGNQTLWYDEADYMSTAKHWAFDIPYNLNVHRPPLFQLLAALGFMIGLSELVLKFIIVLLPSVALVYVVYLLGKEMYDEKIGLIAGFLTAVSWTLLFWGMRFQPDFFSMCFSVLAVLFMWKYWKTEKTSFTVYAGIFAALGLLFKVSGLLVPMIFIIFILCKDRLSALKNKDYYWFSLAFLGTLLPYFIWSYIKFGTPFSFAVGYSSAIEAALPFAWHVIQFFYILSENVLFVLFLAGLILSLKFLLYADILVSDKKKCFDAGLFSVIALAVITAFYIFYIRSIEDRWVFLWLPFMFMMTGNALMFIYNFGKKYSKILSVIIVIGLLAWGGYSQLTHANSLIKDKIGSYSQVKSAALWIKDNSAPSDIIFTISYPQTTYYSERECFSYSEAKDSDEFTKLVMEKKPKYIEISIFENHPEWAYNWAEGRNDTRIARVYFADEAKKQASLIIYEFDYGRIAENKSLNIGNILNGTQ